MAALNKNNSAVKRIMQEAKELANDPSTDYSASPLEDDIFEWHCTLRGPQGTEFEGGLYHFRILLPAEYPFRPPAIMMLTPNGRFELNTKICISFTNYHEELWQPAWGVRTAIIGLQGFFPLKGQAAVGVGSIEYPASERKRLAALSRNWTCSECQQTNLALLPDPSVPTLTNTEPEPIPTTESVPSTDSSNPDFTASAMPPTVTENHDEAKPFSTTPTSTPDSELLSHSAGQQATRITSHLQSDVTNGNIDQLNTRRESVTRSETSPTNQSPRRSRRSTTSQKPPVLLDTAICILLVLLFAIICRRVV